MVPERPKGITKHYLPHRRLGKPDGCDQTRRDQERILAEYAFAVSAVESLLPPVQKSQHVGQEAAERAKHRMLPDDEADTKRVVG